MTREEAIGNLDMIRIAFIDTVTVEQGMLIDETFITAIKALEQEPCEDAISRQAVNEIINDIRDCISVEGYWAILERLKKLPPVNPQPKTGRWIFDKTLDEHYYCSECKSMGVDYWDYCPDCGAKMIEPQESEGTDADNQT